MMKNLMKRKNAFILSIFTFLFIGIFSFTNELMLLVEAHNSIPYSIDWTNTNLITVDNTWSVSIELGVRGYSGADTPIVPGTDARTFLTESLILDVDANETNPDTLVEGGVAEFEIANPTIALKGSDTAHSPYINLLMDSRGLQNIRLRCNVRDIDSTANNAVQQVAVQFRTRDDETGPYTDVPSAYIADATQGGTATMVTPIDVILPPEAEGRIALEIRIMTVNAVGEDEWIGIDDIMVTAEGPTPVGTVSGRITYANALTTTSVPFTTLNATGSIPLSTMTDANGLYSITGFGAGAYTITPTKANQVNGISNLDASRIAQHIVGLTTLIANQQIAADTSGNGAVSSLDAAYIAQFVAAIPNPSITGTWKFLPASRSYSNIMTNQTDQDFSAILVGDVTGNWNPAGPLHPALSEVAASEQTMQNVKAAKAGAVAVTASAIESSSEKGTLTLNLAAAETTGEGILGYQFDLLYNAAIIEPQAVGCDVSETLSRGMTAICHASESGVLKVVVFGVTPMSGEGTLLKLNFNVIGAGGSTSPLTIKNFIFNEDISPEVTAIGQILAADSTAETISIR